MSTVESFPAVPEYTPEETPAPSGARLPDELTAWQAIGGDEEAIGQVCMTLTPLIRSKLRTLGSHGSEAVADATQITYTKIIPAIERFDPTKGKHPEKEIDLPVMLAGWVGRIASNTAIDYGRKEGRQIPVSPLLETDEYGNMAAQLEGNYFGQRTIDPEEAYDINNLGWAADALAQIPADFCEAVVAVDLQGKSPKQYAAETGIKLPTVRTRLHRGRKAIREMIVDGTIDIAEDARALAHRNSRQS